MNVNMVVDLSGALKAAIGADAAARHAAEAQLATFRDQNLPGYLASLISELNNDARDADVRQAAGLMLKNTVDAREEARRKELQLKWVAVDPTLKQHIREMLLKASTRCPQSYRVRRGNFLRLFCFGVGLGAGAGAWWGGVGGGGWEGARRGHVAVVRGRLWC